MSQKMLLCPSKNQFSHVNSVTQNSTCVFSCATKEIAPSDRKSLPGGKSCHVCFYCLKPDHLIAECQPWEKKDKSKKVAHVKTVSVARNKSMQSFIFSGIVSLSGIEPQPLLI